MTIIGGLLLVAGFIIIYLVSYGRTLFYSQTYYQVAKFLPPIWDIWALISGLQFVLMLALFALIPGTKFRMIELFGRHPRARLVVGVLGLTLSVAVGLLLISGKVFQYPRLVAILATGETYIFVVILAALSLSAFSLAFYPAVISRQLNRPTWLMRCFATVLGTLLGLFVIAVLELHIAEPIAKQVITSASQDATHDISVIIVDQPSRISPGDSIPIEIRFRATKHVDQTPTTAYRYPVTLPPGRDLLVGVSLRAVGFEVASPTEDQLKPRPLVLDHPILWTWLISSKPGREDTSQSLAFNVFFKDQKSNAIVFESPVTSIQISVGTPLGLPSWLVSANVAIGTIIGGLVAILLPWVLTRASAALDARKNERQIIIPK
jgi:hypothetical protein